MQPGDRFQQSFEVNAAVYEGFLRLFNDRNPLHTDEAFAAGKGFRGRVMHGNILNGFLSYFVGECLPTKDVIIHSQQIEYRQPVYLGDTLEFTAVIDDVHESVRAVAIKYHFSNQGGVKVAQGKIQIGLLP